MLTYAYVQEGALEAVAEALSRHCATCEDVAMRALDAALAFARYALYLLYWYKSTNTDAMWRCVRLMPPSPSLGMHFTGTRVQILTGTRVQILRCVRLMPPTLLLGTHFTCFTGTRVQILTQKLLGGQGVGKEGEWLSV